MKRRENKFTSKPQAKVAADSSKSYEYRKLMDFEPGTDRLNFYAAILDA